jgi:hypothetical protein
MLSNLLIYFTDKDSTSKYKIIYLTKLLFLVYKLTKKNKLTDLIKYEILLLINIFLKYNNDNLLINELLIKLKTINIDDINKDIINNINLLDETKINFMDKFYNIYINKNEDIHSSIFYYF